MKPKNPKNLSHQAARMIMLGALLTLPAASVALAQGTQQERSDCMGDAFKFCGSDIPNVDAIEACLKSNLNQLSPECRTEFEPTSRSRMKREHFG
jgi:hypothetical protein